MTPEQTLRHVEAQYAAMQKAKATVVKVGLPAGETATSKAYTNDGAGAAPTVLEVGVWHEYGFGNVPMRSFLRAPFKLKAPEMAKTIETQWHLVLEKGLGVGIALGRVGLAAKNISTGAFRTRGYGVWPASKVDNRPINLTDTGILKNAITWVVE